MAHQFMQIKPLLIGAIEIALNGYLGLDDQLESYLAPMAGKVIAIHILPFDETLYLCPAPDRIQLLEHYIGDVDARLSGSLSALSLMGLSATPMRSLFKGDVKIEGDTQLASKLQRLFEKLDINLEAHLTRYAGGRFARSFIGLLRGGRDWTEQSMTRLRLNLEEFLQEETRELPAKAEAEIVFRAIDVCRADTDRLAARIERLLAAEDSASEHR
jgi:ubiquinone biosynthesis protein UbiJ